MIPENRIDLKSNFDDWASVFQDKVIEQEQAFIKYKEEELDKLDLSIVSINNIVILN